MCSKGATARKGYALALRARGETLGACRPSLALRARGGLPNINSSPPVSLSSSRFKAGPKALPFKLGWMRAALSYHERLYNYVRAHARTRARARISDAAGREIACA
jgi:hypothetical protein